MKLNNWWFVQLTNFVVMGYGSDGRFIQTRRVIEFDPANNRLVTDGATYKLGEPDKVWLRSIL